MGMLDKRREEKRKTDRALREGKGPRGQRKSGRRRNE